MYLCCLEILKLNLFTVVVVVQGKISMIVTSSRRPRSSTTVRSKRSPKTTVNRLHGSRRSGG
jgi:aspartokinase